MVGQRHLASPCLGRSLATLLSGRIERRRCLLFPSPQLLRCSGGWLSGKAIPARPRADSKMHACMHLTTVCHYLSRYHTIQPPGDAFRSRGKLRLSGPASARSNQIRTQDVEPLSCLVVINSPNLKLTQLLSEILPCHKAAQPGDIFEHDLCLTVGLRERFKYSET